ncbi:hypothetical protein S2M10_29400 [Sphingomonas sp. S2M10]|uniref:portal protein n=1 Tax=Sphingomonas sp. S2M10 TaxID=2705010 RepID=UPI001456AA77|nr:portal protein [Sphingomonas sp. S2M10]NLS27938.1 hypothetical protein [Sphingomonas sp. S2M10]
MFDPKQIEAAQSRMESARSLVDAECQEAAAILLDESPDFNVRYTQEGRNNTRFVYDEYGAQALQDGVSVFEGFTMPRGQKWQKLSLVDRELSAVVENAQWLEKVEDRLFALRNDPESGFVTNIHSFSEMLLSMWGGSIYVDKRYDDYGRFAGISYQAEDPAGVWVERTKEGTIKRLHRLLILTAEQVVDTWGDDAPKSAREAMQGMTPRPDKEIEILHVIERNGRRIEGRLDMAGKPWIGCYYSRPDKAVFKTGGYDALPRIVAVFARKASKNYGRSPGLRVLPALRASQIMMQDRVLGVEYQLKRPMLAEDDDLDQGVIDLGPFGITYGGMENGRPKLQPLMDAPNLQDAAGLHAEVHQVLDRAFWRDLLQLNRELKTHISAYRTKAEEGEKGVLLAPLARQEQELFAPMTARELHIMWDEGMLEDMPPRLRDYFGRGGKLKLGYDNPLNQMMLANEAAAYLQTAEQVATIAPFDPSAVGEFTREYPLAKVIPGLGRANGIPAKWQATDDEKAQSDAQAAQQQQLQQLIQVAPAIADASKSAAEAGAISGIGA